MIYILNQAYNNIFMRCLIQTIALLLSFSLYSQGSELPALRLSDSFTKPYRVLNKTIYDKYLFEQ